MPNGEHTGDQTQHCARIDVGGKNDRNSYFQISAFSGKSKMLPLNKWGEFQ